MAIKPLFILPSLKFFLKLNQNSPDGVLMKRLPLNLMIPIFKMPQKIFRIAIVIGMRLPDQLKRAIG